MIRLSELSPVGKTGKPHGIGGELTFEFTSESFDIDECTYFVFDIDSILVPFFIESYRFKSNSTALVKLEGIHNEAEARELSNKTIYIPKSLLDEEDEAITFSYFKGFKVIDAHAGTLGEIDAIDESTENVLFEVGEYLIPANDDFIEEIDYDNRILRVNLPHGLLDL